MTKYHFIIRNKKTMTIEDVSIRRLKKTKEEITATMNRQNESDDFYSFYELAESQKEIELIEFADKMSEYEETYKDYCARKNQFDYETLERDYIALEEENARLREVNYSLSHYYRERLGYLSSNKWTDKTAISVEMERLEKEQLRDRLEHEVKMIKGAANDEINKLSKENLRLREALELIEESCEFCGFEYARKALEKSE